MLYNIVLYHWCCNLYKKCHITPATHNPVPRRRTRLSTCISLHTTAHALNNKIMRFNNIPQLLLLFFDCSMSPHLFNFNFYLFFLIILFNFSIFSLVLFTYLVRTCNKHVTACCNVYDCVCDKRNLNKRNPLLMHFQSENPKLLQPWSQTEEWQLQHRHTNESNRQSCHQCGDDSWREPRVGSPAQE